MREPALTPGDVDLELRTTAERRAQLGVVLALILVSLVPLIPLRLGIPHAHDLPDHAAMASQFRSGLAEGRLYPRWCGDFSWGWGDATGQYYPPGLYYLTALTSVLLGGPIVHGLFAALAVMTTVGMAGIYRLIRAVADRRAALLGCAFFAVAPYRSFEMYGAGLLSAYAAGCILPWLLLSLWKLAKARSPGTWHDIIRPACTFAPLYALLVLTNMPMTVMMTYTIAVWAIVEAATSRSWRVPLRVAVGGVLGSLMAAAYLLPVAMELSYIQPAIANDQELFRSNFLFQRDGSWMSDELRSMFTRIGILQILLFGLSAGILLWRGIPRRRQTGFTGDQSWVSLVGTFGICAVLFATAVSLPLWEVLPFLKKIYMPWRFLDPLATALAALTGAGLAVALFSKDALPRPARIVYVAAVSLLGLTSFGLGSSIATMNGVVSADEIPLVTRTFYERRTYHLPKDAASPEDLIQYPLFGVLPPTTSVEIVEWSTSRRRLRVAATEPTRLALRTYYFPGWRATDPSTGETFPTRAQPPSGGILVELPPGEREIVVSFEATPPRTIGAILSVVAWLGWAGAVLWMKRMGNGPTALLTSQEHAVEVPILEEIPA